MKGVAITGIGMLSDLGRGLTAHSDGLRRGVTALAPLTLFQTEGLGVRPVGQVDDALLDGKPNYSRSQRLALSAANDALGGYRPAGEGVIAIGSTTGGIYESEQHYLKHRGQEGGADRGLLINHAVGTIADRLCRDLQLGGERHTFATACSSSANSIGYAAARVEAGAPWALAGGVDSLCRLTWAGFHSLKLLSSAACKPFDRTRNGLSLGEAAAFLLLEPIAAARARGATIFGLVSGWGCSADAYHMTAPHPEGVGAIAAIRAALSDAGCEPHQIDYVNAHGTATPANDAAEGHALRAVFGAKVPPVSSTKGVTGHSLGAAGALEAAISLLVIREGFLPGNVGLEEVDPAIGFAPLGPATGAATVSRVLSNSFGFGGNNTALVLERAP
ncbi:MAG: hypothetical protein H6Q89_4378 [Myxococcaceae bacterium]|nr:hypothetical protein [Myxococcaceae bacterium]